MILPGDAPSSIAAAVQCLASGGLLGLPTETVYGLAADADNDAAVTCIYRAKGRPVDHPLIVHVADAQAVAHYAAQVPGFARQLIAAFWPGPLTLILPRRAEVARVAAGGHATIGLRCPSHPVAQALLRALRQPLPGQVPIWGLAAPSANQFGRVSPTTAAHVQGEFAPDLLILDGGPCEVGIESTIIDCTRGQPVLLRPGAITPAQVAQVCGLIMRQPQELAAHSAPAPKASGTLESHYAPRARVRLLPAQAMQTAWQELLPSSGTAADCAPDRVAVWYRSALTLPAHGVLHQRMPQDAAAAAQQLFALLRAFDAQGVAEIWIETPPEDPAWDGVRDRLQRAAA